MYVCIYIYIYMYNGNVSIMPPSIMHHHVSPKCIALSCLHLPHASAASRYTWFISRVAQVGSLEGRPVAEIKNIEGLTSVFADDLERRAKWPLQTGSSEKTEEGS